MMAVSAVVVLLWAGPAAQWFPFAIPPLGPTGEAGVAQFNSKAAGADGFLHVAGEHIVDGRGRDVRFFGTNLCFGACFPTHENAERLARRLAELGVNVVRLHHEDTGFFPRGIWDRADKTRRTFSKEALDRYDYLIAQLIRHGIYVNVNLHVGRWPHENDPCPEAGKLFMYGKGVDNFWPPLIEFQKKFARGLLGRVNPYLGRGYADEPGLAFVEINNENSLISVWSRGAMDNLPRPYVEYLQKRWNQWLKERYGTTDKLKRAWAEGEEPLGEEMLRNGELESGLDDWAVQRTGTCELDYAVVSEGPQGKPALRVRVTGPDPVSWHGQVLYRNIKIEKGKAYTLAVWLRADPPRQVSISVMRDHAPWGRLGLNTRVEVGQRWKRYVFGFRASDSDERARVTIGNLAQAVGTVWIAGLSLRPGGVIGLPEGQRLEEGSVAIIKRAEVPRRTRAAAADQVLFYLQLERGYWQTMYDFLKRELGLRALVTGTQVTYSPVYTQEMMDYFDAHAYWQHPRFPGRPWDANNWYVQNVSMVRYPPGTVGRLAAARIAGRPYTVSEYNHPAPNQHAGEALVFLAAYGALQDWSAVYPFTFGQSDEWDADRVERYFNYRSNPVQLVTFPWAAVAMRQRGVAAARERVVVPATLDDAVEAVLSGRRALDATALGATVADTLCHRVAIAWGRLGSKPQRHQQETRRYEADNGQVVWDVAEAGREKLLVRGPRAKAYVGFAAGRQQDLGDGVRLSVEATSIGWAAVTIAQLDGPRVGGPGRVLMTAAAGYRNPGWGWEELGRERVTVRRKWGSGPVEVEGVAAHLTLPVPASRVRAWALDPTGRRARPVAVKDSGQGCAIDIGPQYRTLWYLVEVRR